MRVYVLLRVVLPERLVGRWAKVLKKKKKIQRTTSKTNVSSRDGCGCSWFDGRTMNWVVSPCTMPTTVADNAGCNPPSDRNEEEPGKGKEREVRLVSLYDDILYTRALTPMLPTNSVGSHANRRDAQGTKAVRTCSRTGTAHKRSGVVLKEVSQDTFIHRINGRRRRRRRRW